MTTIKVFTKDEVEKIFNNSSVYMAKFFEDKLKVSRHSASYFEKPEYQLELIAAVDAAHKDLVQPFKNDWSEQLRRDEKEIEELEERVKNKKEHLVIQTKRYKEIKNLPSIKSIFEVLSKM